MKLAKKISLVFLFAFIFTNFVFAQQESVMAVQGTITEIADDGSYMVVNSKKIYTDTDFVEEAYLEVGDTVKIEVENSEKGLQALSYEYIFDDEEDYEEE